MRGEEGGRVCRPGKGIHLIRKVALSEFQQRDDVSRRTSLEGVSGFRVRHVIDRVDREAGRPRERLSPLCEQEMMAAWHGMEGTKLDGHERCVGSRISWIHMWR